MIPQLAKNGGSEEGGTIRVALRAPTRQWARTEAPSDRCESDIYLSAGNRFAGGASGFGRGVVVNLALLSCFFSI